jgi:hypothetical protein
VHHEDGDHGELITLKGVGPVKVSVLMRGISFRLSRGIFKTLTNLDLLSAEGFGVEGKICALVFPAEGPDACSVLIVTRSWQKHHWETIVSTGAQKG